MKVTLVPSSVAADGSAPASIQHLTSYLVDDSLVIDAGCVGLLDDPEKQSQVRRAFLSHTHLDHIASLPILVENAYRANRAGITIHASEYVIACLKTNMFNWDVWPDFVALSTAETSFLRFETIEPGRSVSFEGFVVTPIEVNHVVPTLGFVIEDETSAIVVSSDTGPTEAIWERARSTKNLKAVFLEATFPAEMHRLADLSKHLTTETFAREVEKIDRSVRVIAVHIKARYHRQVVTELEAYRLANVEIGRFGVPYCF